LNLALQKVAQSIKMAPSAIKIGKQMNVLAYADDIVLDIQRNVHRDIFL
jgi:hypothetical protein